MGLRTFLGLKKGASPQQRRRLAKDRMPRTALAERHTAGAALLPTREALLERLPADAVVCEVGVAGGDFSSAIARIAHPRKLHLIDAWSDARYAGDLRLVQEKFRDEIGSGTVEIHQGLSTERLAAFPDGHFDWAYIDTNHSYETTAAELQLCKTKVRPGGRIAGHDFCTGNVVTPVVYGVVEACLEFCVQANWRFEYLTLDPDGHFSFCLKEIEG